MAVKVSNLEILEICIQNDELTIPQIARLKRCGIDKAREYAKQVRKYCNTKMDEALKAEDEQEARNYNIQHLRYLPTDLVIEALEINLASIKEKAKLEKGILGIERGS